MTPMLACAQSVALHLLAAAGRKPGLVPGTGDELATWCRLAFSWVDDPTTISPPPAAAVQLCELVRDGSGTRRDQLTAWACTLAMAVWTIVDDAVSTAWRDPEGDGTAEEHEALRRRLLADWATGGKLEALTRAEAALAEALPKAVQKLLI